MLTYTSLEVFRNAESWLGHAYVLAHKKHLNIQAFCLHRTVLFHTWSLEKNLFEYTNMKDNFIHQSLGNRKKKDHSKRVKSNAEQQQQSL